MFCQRFSVCTNWKQNRVLIVIAVPAAYLIFAELAGEV